MFFKLITTRVVSTAAVLGSLFVVLMIFPSIVRSLLYFPSHHDEAGRGGDGFEAFRDAEGNFLGYIRESAKASHTVIVFHGNAGEALHRTWYAAPLQNARVHIILAEYPGYGAHPGKPAESSIFESADIVVHEAEKLGLPLIIVGESLGSGVACYVASKHPIYRLALISPFSSMSDTAQAHYGWIARILLPDRYESTLYLAKYQGPLHVIHGSDDEVVPIALGRKLFASYTGREGEFAEIPRFHHNDIAEAILEHRQAARFRSFIRGEHLR